MKKILFLSLLFFLLLPAKTFASFVYPSYSYPQLTQTGQKAVIWHENGKETIVISTTFTNAPWDFGWLIPVPSKPVVDEASDEIFTALEDLTRPKGYVDRGPLEPAFQAPGLSDKLDSTPTEPLVIDSKQVGIFDTTILEAKDPKALSEWLTKNNYSYPTDRSYAIKSYIDQGWYFVAVRVNAEAQDYAQNFSQTNGHTLPLRISFDSQQIIYPIKLSGPGLPTTKQSSTKVAAFSFEQGLEGFYASPLYDPLLEKNTPNRSQTGANIPAIDYYPQPTVTLDDTTAQHGTYSLKLAASGAQPQTLAAQATISNLKPGKTYTLSAFAKATNAKNATVSVAAIGATTSQSSQKSSTALKNWERLSTTFVAPEQYMNVSLQVKNIANGESINWDAVQLEEGGVPSDFTDEVIPSTQVYPTPYTSDITLTFYVFSDHKQTLPGFTTSYASWVAPNKIEKLAFTQDGKAPWIDAKKKMYLTKLYRQMKPSEMTTDFIFRDADNNDPVNSEGLADFSGMRFFVLVFVILALEIGGIVAFVYFKRRRADNVQPNP